MSTIIVAEINKPLQLNWLTVSRLQRMTNQKLRQKATLTDNARRCLGELGVFGVIGVGTLSRSFSLISVFSRRDARSVAVNNS